MWGILHEKIVNGFVASGNSKKSLETLFGAQEEIAFLFFKLQAKGEAWIQGQLLNCC